MIVPNTYVCSVKSDEPSAFIYETIRITLIKFIFFQIFRPFLESSELPFQRSKTAGV